MKYESLMGYRHENNRIGIRNHVVILPLDDLSNNLTSKESYDQCTKPQSSPQKTRANRLEDYHFIPKTMNSALFALLLLLTPLVIGMSNASAQEDNTKPTVVLSSALAGYNGTVPIDITVTFSEPVYNFGVTDIFSPITGSLSGVDGDTIYTLTITPDSSERFTRDINLDLPEASCEDGSGNYNEMSNILPLVFDNVPPEVTLTLIGPNTVNASTVPFMVVVMFDEPVTGFVKEDLNGSGAIMNATVTEITEAIGGQGQRYIMTMMPVTDGPISISIPAGVAMDIGTNPNEASNTLDGVTYDGVNPTVTLSSALTTPNVNSTAMFDVAVTFSESVDDFELTDVFITASTATATLAGSGASYTLTITPTDTGTSGDIDISIPKGIATDTNGNFNEASTNTLTVAYDIAAPTVRLSSALTSFNSAVPFLVAVTFSEPVTGFETTDVTISTATATVTGISAPVVAAAGGQAYTLSITPTDTGSNGNIEISISADVVIDAAINGNVASNTLVIENIIVADTKAAITGFMLDRANKLASNQPSLARFLQDTGCASTFSANSTDASGSVKGCLSRDQTWGETWGEINSTWSSGRSYTLATLGAHRFSDNTIIGMMLQFDLADYDTRNITGEGWLAGPYFAYKQSEQNVTFEGRLLYGQTNNDITPLGNSRGSYTDSFESERYLAQLRVTGAHAYRTATFMPLLDFTYTEDTQGAYTDTLGNLITEQIINLMQVTFGMDFRLPMTTQSGRLDFTGGLSGIHSETNGGVGEADFNGSRGRAELGLNYRYGNGNGSGNRTTLHAGIFYDGISSNYESFGVNFSLDMRF